MALRFLAVLCLLLTASVHAYIPRVGKPLNTKRSVNRNSPFPVYNISVPVDHFFNESKYEPHTDETFELRYWFNPAHYEPGGPVIVILAGETSGEDRIPFIQDGIGNILAEATNGLSVVLEHRYYGESLPTRNLSTESLRFLTTQQALADTAFFARNAVFDGFEDQNLTAPNAPWILYGGSYAGGFAAFSRVLYPDLYWGAISSSGVTEAIVDFWSFYEAMRLYGPKKCISTDQKLVNVLDNIMIGRNDSNLTRKLKGLFGVAELSHDSDFAWLIANGIAAWESLFWDPRVNDPAFFEFCGNITAGRLLYPETAKMKNTAAELIELGGWGKELPTLTTSLLNLVGWVNHTEVSPCTQSGQTIEQCFGQFNVTFYEQDDISQTWRAWPYQTCTQWGYWQVGSTAPKEMLPLVSRTIDIPSQTFLCKAAFGIDTEPNVDEINQYGGFDIEAERLAFIGGEWDSWRWASTQAPNARQRPDTLDKPVFVIPDAVHHWDEYGRNLDEIRPGQPPLRVIHAQLKEVAFVRAWLAEWRASRQHE